MRHRVYGKHLGRDKNQRTALFKSLVQSLFSAETIQTTEAKAKAIKGLVDKLINQAKISNRQHLVNQFLTGKQTAEKLISDIAPRFSNRTSGYTSIVKLGTRQGDGAMLVQMSLVEGDRKIEKPRSSKVSTKKLPRKGEKK